ncbi:MAG: TlpA family protein disulfide reductase [Rhodocyclales bacterium]|nr:TlpA family protein disulfide reductase [Rhodocyclales bacterium]
MRRIHSLAAAAMLLLGLLSPVARADLEVGQTADRPGIELIDGSMLDTGHHDGKVVVALFWATWCPICMSELPEYQKLYQAYKARGLEIIAVSLDREPGVVSEYWRRSGYTFPAAMRTDAIRQAYGGIKGTPTLYLLDRRGVLRYKHLGGLPYEELEKQVKALL